MNQFKQEDDDEIVAIQFDNEIYFKQAAVDKVLELKDFTILHSRWIFKFMAMMDLDPRWKEFASYPTLFRISEVEAFTKREDYIFDENNKK